MKNDDVIVLPAPEWSDPEEMVAVITIHPDGTHTVSQSTRRELDHEHCVEQTERYWRHVNYYGHGYAMNMMQEEGR